MPELEAYLRRIGHAGGRAPTLETLRQLHLLHPQAIAFENLSPLLGEGVPLDPGALWTKLVHGGRGGYCFEHNLLFRDVLERMGFEVSGLAARVLWNRATEAAGPRTHMLLLIALDGRRYIADVGFGNVTLTAPLELDSEAEQTTPHETFRLSRLDGERLLEIRIGGKWKPVFAFDLQEASMSDYESANRYASCDPQSQFVTRLIASRVAPGRRFTLRDNSFAIHHLSGETERRSLATVDNVKNTLQSVFGLSLPGSPGLDRKLKQIIQS